MAPPFMTGLNFKLKEIFPYKASRLSHLDTCSSMEHASSVICTHNTPDVTHKVGHTWAKIWCPRSYTNALSLPYGERVLLITYGSSFLKFQIQRTTGSGFLEKSELQNHWLVPFVSKTHESMVLMKELAKNCGLGRFFSYFLFFENAGNISKPISLSAENNSYGIKEPPYNWKEFGAISNSTQHWC